MSNALITKTMNDFSLYYTDELYNKLSVVFATDKVYEMLMQGEDIRNSNEFYIEEYKKFNQFRVRIKGLGIKTQEDGISEKEYENYKRFRKLFDVLIVDNVKASNQKFFFDQVNAAQGLLYTLMKDYQGILELINKEENFMTIHGFYSRVDLKVKDFKNRFLYLGKLKRHNIIIGTQAYSELLEMQRTVNSKYNEIKRKSRVSGTIDSFIRVFNLEYIKVKRVLEDENCQSISELIDKRNIPRSDINVVFNQRKVDMINRTIKNFREEFTNDEINKNSYLKNVDLDYFLDFINHVSEVAGIMALIKPKKENNESFNKLRGTFIDLFEKVKTFDEFNDELDNKIIDKKRDILKNVYLDSGSDALLAEKAFNEEFKKLGIIDIIDNKLISSYYNLYEQIKLNNLMKPSNPKLGVELRRMLKDVARKMDYFILASFDNDKELYGLVEQQLTGKIEFVTDVCTRIPHKYSKTFERDYYSTCPQEISKDMMNLLHKYKFVVFDTYNNAILKLYNRDSLLEKFENYRVVIGDIIIDTNKVMDIISGYVEHNKLITSDLVKMLIKQHQYHEVSKLYNDENSNVLKR